ncbi:hypothetical protein MRX96_018752 [Rhipicephalus microplus]
MAANEATKEVETHESIQASNSHLISLLQKTHDLKEAWRKNKLYIHLCAKNVDLAVKWNFTPKRSAPSSWNNSTCDEADGKFRREANGGLLKHIMADSDKPTRGGTQLQIERLVHKHAQDSGGPQALLKTLGEKYIPLESKAVAWENEKFVI